MKENKLKIVKLKISQKREDTPTVETPTTPQRFSLPLENEICINCQQSGIVCIKNSGGPCTRCSYIGLECSMDIVNKKRKSWTLGEEDNFLEKFNFDGNFEQSLLWHLDMIKAPSDDVPYFQNKRHSLNNEETKQEVERLENLIEQQRREIEGLKTGILEKKKRSSRGSNEGFCHQNTL